MEQWHSFFPFWNNLSKEQQTMIASEAKERQIGSGTLLRNGSDCVGLLLVKQGQLRVYVLSDEGKELTLYRLYERDICLFSASCMISSLQFDVFVAAERDTTILHLSPEAYKQLMNSSLAVANYTNQLMASRFSDVMWLLDQILNKKLDSRLGALLLEERDLNGSNELRVTHEQLANHLGSVREVVSRMLKHFQNEGLVQLGRGGIRLLDVSRLRLLAAESMR